MRPDLIEQDLITSADITNSSKTTSNETQIRGKWSTFTDNQEGKPGKTCADRSTFSCLTVIMGVPGISQRITEILQSRSVMAASCGEPFTVQK